MKEIFRHSREGELPPAGEFPRTPLAVNRPCPSLLRHLANLPSRVPVLFESRTEKLTKLFQDLDPIWECPQWDIGHGNG